MDDGDNEGLHTALNSDRCLVAATALATLVVAGSAFIWRSNPWHILGDSHNQLGPETSKSAGTSSKGSTAGAAIVVREERGDESETKEVKSARSKERRRRGKDPLKDILKNVKKSKVLAKPSMAGDPEDNGAGQGSALPRINEVTRHSQTQEASNATSSRSLSSTSSRRSPPPSSDKVSSYPSSSQGSHTGDGDDEDDGDTPPAASSSIPKTCDSLAGVSQPPTSSLSPPVSHPSKTPSSTLESDPPIPSRTAVSPNIPLPSSSSASQFSSIHSSDSVITPNTSPTISQSGKTPTVTQVDMTPHAVGPASSPSVHATQKTPGPWDWDGTGPSATSETTYQKPPRFRSKSRGSGSISMSPLIPLSVPSDNYSSDLAPSSPRMSSPRTSTTHSLASVGLHDDLNHSFTFPSDSSGKRLSDPPTAGPSHAGNTAYLNGNGNANGSLSTPRRAPTPRRPPTPLSGTGTPPPSLSTQTQLASLRGALEAARLREEKTKADIERYLKELEMLRWEGAAWRRREAELQAQVHHLVHQLQTYTALFASMTGQPPPIPQHHLPPGGNPNANGNPGPAPNGYQFSPPSSIPRSPPPHAQIPSAQMLFGNGLLTSPSMLSPTSMSMAHTSPHSPFYPYPSHSPHPYPLPQPQQPAQSPLQTSTNTFSMMFPPHAVNTNGGTGSGSGPSSVAGSSSVGSHSPDLAGPSSTPPPTSSVDRGRRPTSSRTQAAGSRISGGAWDGEGSEGWHVGDEEVPADAGDGKEANSDEDDEEGIVNEALADAILKRPASIRGLSRKAKVKDRGGEREKEKEVQHTEFTFPSLSDFGNVSRMYSVPVATVPVEGEDAADDANDEAVDPAPAAEGLTESSQTAPPDHPDLTAVEVQQEIPS
ncbi:hypothetical protein LshimejAT787_0902700 [Lyophyllum shimeji]|uniref:Uncharacterized protein n=1 Tax=Lyophyllum shimeji TaxID=47721 RepID=A0A9P3PQX9_LYOSH|nr:hypothetical protein LshimejAT787_0902700 [Lyophyllum shimeji]